MSSRRSASPEYDNISDTPLKSVREVISKLIAHIINISVKKDIFPTNYKKTIVTPIFKSGDEVNISNYRPTSLILDIAKGSSWKVTMRIANTKCRHTKNMVQNCLSRNT